MYIIIAFKCDACIKIGSDIEIKLFREFWNSFERHAYRNKTSECESEMWYKIKFILKMKYYFDL